MKSKIAIICSVAVILASATIHQSGGNATVRMIDGTEVYVMCDPVRKYEVVGEAKYAGKLSESIYERIRGHVRSARTWQKDVDFDALLFDEKRGAQLIKFKD